MSGACYENGLLGKPAGEPGLAEYFSDVDGVCVKDSSYVPCPDLTCCDIDALACFSSRATRERPLPAAAEASNFRDSRQPPPTLRDLLPVFPRPAADRPSPPRAASSAVCRSSPSPPATVSCSASASSSPSSPPPWYVHAVRKFQQTSKTVTLRGFPKRVSRLSPTNPHSRFSGSIGERFLAKPLRDVDASTRGTQTVFRDVSRRFFRSCGEDRQMEKKRSPTDEPSLPLTPK